MEKIEAKKQLENLIGKDLRELANQYGISVNNKNYTNKNKGWAGLVIEKYLGLPPNSLQSPDFGDWELKLVSLEYGKRGEKKGQLKVKETMQITMINPKEVTNKKFNESHVFQKLNNILVVARIYDSIKEYSSLVHSVTYFDLSNPNVYEQVANDYNEIQNTIIHQGFEDLSGKMGKFIQPRTKGRGHGSTSRAFYARKQFVADILGI